MKTISAKQLVEWEACWDDVTRQTIMGIDPIDILVFLNKEEVMPVDKLWAVLRSEYLSVEEMKKLENEFLKRMSEILKVKKHYPNNEVKNERRNKKLWKEINRVQKENKEDRLFTICCFIKAFVEEDEYVFYVQRLKEILNG